MAPAIRHSIAMLLLLGALIAGCGGGSPEPLTVTETAEEPSSETAPDAGTTSGAQPPGAPEAAAPEIVPPVSLFSSPTGNIGCAIDKDYARCDISSKSWEAPGDSSCELEYGDAIEVSGNGEGEFVCHGDTTRGSDDTLEYGDSIQATRSGAVVCSSAESGMTCENRDTGHGFSISREAYDTF